MSRSPRVAPKFGAIGIWSVALFMSACLWCPPDPIVSTPECPRSWTGFWVVWDTSPRMPPVAVQIGAELSVPGRKTNVPEFHDCQRLIVRESGRPRYDSLYAVFAAEDLNTLVVRLDSLYGRPREPSAPGLATQAIGLPAAEIMSLGGVYEPLGIEPGFNCLYFFRDSTEWHENRPRLKAKMHPVGPNEKDCAEPVNVLPLRGKVLVVREDAPAGFLDDDYPPAARWDWDSLNVEQYIGIKCGAAWCEVGDSGFVSSPTHDRPDLPRQQRRVYRIKGWYDEQVLARRTGNGTQPYGDFARIIPDPFLDAATLAKFAQGWVHVATAIMPSDPGDYPLKMNYDSGENHLFLCMGTVCAVPDSLAQIAQRKMTAENLPQVDPSRMVWARIVSSRGRERMTHVIRKDHSGLEASMKEKIPATARWRWILDDETNWIRCDEGCCHPEPPPPP